MRGIILLISLTFALFCRSLGEIGDITVRKASPLVLNEWQQTQCEKMLPLSATCDTAYQTVDEYCHNYATKVDKTCDKSYANLKNSCNKAETKIKDECKKSNGYVTAKCGKLFDRLKKYCRVGSETISRSCTSQYKKMDEICSKMYGKNDRKCNKVYKQYEDLCEGLLEENVRNDQEMEEEVKFNENENEIEEIKKLAMADFKPNTDLKISKRETHFLTLNSKAVSLDFEDTLSAEKRGSPVVKPPVNAAKPAKKPEVAAKPAKKPEVAANKPAAAATKPGAVSKQGPIKKPVGKSVFDYFEKERKSIMQTASEDEEF